MTLITQHVPPNKQGTDYFIGDIHGCYSQVMSILDEIGFEFDKDRLFCTGDLPDRNLESYECLTLLDEPWFFSVRGNHEQMLYDALWEEDRDMFWCWMSNGGGWDVTLTPEQEHKLHNHYLPLIGKLPHVIIIGEITLVHADYYGLDNTSVEQVLWGRTRHKKKDESLVPDTKVVVCGHTPVDVETWLGNVVYIDTGGWYSGGRFTIKSREYLEMMYD